MAGWFLIACLKQLFAEFNVIAPSRGHASDGSIGDTAHQHEVSDHNPDETGSVPIHDADHVNEVHAIDVDVDLCEPGLTMEMVVQFLLGRCRAGTEKRLRYIIYNRRIWEASNGWRQRPYTGASAHTEHAHFSASYDTKLEASTASWHLEDIPVAMTAADKTWQSAEFKKQVVAGLAEMKDDIAKAVLVDYRFDGTQIPGSAYRRNLSELVGDPWSMIMRGDTFGGDPIPGGSMWAQLLTRLTALEAKIEALSAGPQAQ